MKRRLLFVLFFAIVFSLAGCNTVSEQFSKAGLLGEHPVRSVEKQSSLSGEIHGTYFLLLGAMNGEITTGTTISFTWAPEDDSRITSDIPREKILVKIDNNKKAPTVEFIFDETYLSNNYNNTNNTDFLNRNKFLTGANFIVAVVRISEEDLLANPALPQ